MKELIAEIEKEMTMLYALSEKTREKYPKSVARFKINVARDALDAALNILRNQKKP